MRHISTVGDPDAPLLASTLIGALQRVRLAGDLCDGLEYRLHPDQEGDVEMCLVAGAYNEVLFRGVRVVCTAVGDTGYLSSTTGRVDILSSRQGPIGDRVSDPRKEGVPPGQLAALSVEREVMRRACMTDAERLSERMDRMSDRMDALEVKVGYLWARRT